jgi:hypothetical protein
VPPHPQFWGEKNSTSLCLLFLKLNRVDAAYTSVINVSKVEIRFQRPQIFELLIQYRLTWLMCPYE